MRLPLTYSHAWLALSLALPGCFGTSTGNPVIDPGGETGNAGGGYCKRTSSRPLALDEQTPLGFSAQDVLAFAEGTHQETLTWHAHPRGSYGPESGEHQLTLRVTRRDAPPRLAQYSADTGGAEIGLAGGDCSEAVEIDVRVELQTDGGALDESFDYTLVARGGRKVAIFKHLDEEKLGGSFAFEQIDGAGYRLAQLDLSIALTSFGTSGALSAIFEMRSADGNAVGNGPNDNGAVASWGPPSCGAWSGDPVPADQPIAGFSGDDVLEAIGAISDVNVSVNGGPASSASFAFVREGGVCAQLEPDPYSPLGPDAGLLIIRGVLSVRSQDGRLDAAWPVQLNARPDQGGALGEVTFAFDDQRVPQQGSIQARYGLSGVDASSYDYSGARLQLVLSPPGPLTGALTVTGYKLPMCSSEPVRDDQGRIVGSNGCPGSTPTELAVVSLSSAP